MTLKLAVGYSTQLIEAKERAIYFYEKVEGRKRFEFVETHKGKNEIDQDVWVTTIWFTELADPVENKPEEKFEFIGSTGIDPDDPNWYTKWTTLQDNANQTNDNQEHTNQTAQIEQLTDYP